MVGNKVVIEFNHAYDGLKTTDSEKYSSDAFIICREQWGMDGYTLWGNSYSGAYYPSKNNMQTPTQNLEN